MFKSLAHFCYCRRRLMLLGWLGLLIGLSVLGSVAGGAFRTEFKLPGSESQAALDILKEKGFATRTGLQGQIVFQAPGGIDQPAIRSAMEGFFAQIGIGVGIDYALFIVTRYKQGLRDGLDPEAAVVRSMDTSGRAVLFAGTTVVISVLGLFAMNLALMRGLAIGAALGVLMTMFAALTLLPAILGFVGRNIDKLSLPQLGESHANGTSIWF